jgi:hypothetical protein
MQIKISAVLKGLLTYCPGLEGFVSTETGAASSARYCYSVWLRHLIIARNNGFWDPIATVVELGPGHSLGVGLAALLSGATTYFAVDSNRFATTQRNLRLLNELVDLFAARADVPDDVEFPFVVPRLRDYKFPQWLNTPEFERALDGSRLSSIRRALERVEDGAAITIRYLVPRSVCEEIPESSVDLVMSQAVMEHVEDIAGMYRLIAKWLRPGGLMSHSIDFKSHGFTSDWNGHWTIPSRWWTLVRARRRFGINRMPHSAHITQIQAIDFRIVVDDINRKPGFHRSKLAPEFAHLLVEDLTACEAFIQAVKDPLRNRL